jgi:hypothetical protein
MASANPVRRDGEMSGVVRASFERLFVQGEPEADRGTERDDDQAT